METGFISTTESVENSVEEVKDNDDFVLGKMMSNRTEDLAYVLTKIEGDFKRIKTYKSGLKQHIALFRSDNALI